MVQPVTAYSENHRSKTPLPDTIDFDPRAGSLDGRAQMLAIRRAALGLKSYVDASEASEKPLLMKQYLILRSNSGDPAFELGQKVQIALNNGFELFGPPFCGPEHTHMYQAVIKEKVDSKEPIPAGMI